MHNRRRIISKLNTVEAAHKLVDEIAPKLSARTSGHLRIKRTELRRGDNTQLARISFVDDLSTKTAKESKHEEFEPAKDANTSKEPTATAPRSKK